MRALRLLMGCCLALVLMGPTRVFAENKELPDSLVLGAGWQEIFKNYPYKNGADFRLEHRWGLSLLSSLSEYFKPVDNGLQIHPFLGIETNTRVSMYGFGGLVLDFLIGDHIVVSPNFTIGYYSQGQGKRLGYPVEFRSTFEAGYRFESEWRITGYISHVSNAALGRKNPGVEMGGIYLHIPLIN